MRFAYQRRRCYLALDAGLGKTPVAAVLARLLLKHCGTKTVYVTPPFLVRNVENEFQKWAPSLRVEVYGRVGLSERHAKIDELQAIDVLIVPDSLLTRPELYSALQRFVGARGDLRSIFARRERNALLVVDEAHRYKEAKSGRTAALLGRAYAPAKPARPARFGKPAFKAKPAVPAMPGLVRLFQRRHYLSGTPLPNGRPLEIYPILDSEAPETIDFMSYWDYGVRFCAGKRNHFGWDFKGHSNVKEFRERLQGGRWPFMLRMRKELLKLPPKLEEVFILSADMSPKLARLSHEVAEAYGGGGPDTVRKLLAASHGVSDPKALVTATYQRLLGKEKVKPAAEYIDSVLEGGEALIVFAVHVDVVEALSETLRKWRPFVITGKTPMGARQGQVDEFQTSKDRNLFIGNVDAMGVGFTLTKAARVIFVEYSWVPGVNSQASDRAHRIGQDKSVLVQYLVYKSSVDADVMDALLTKSQVLAQV